MTFTGPRSHASLYCGAAVVALLSAATPAFAADFNIKPQSLETALKEFSLQSKQQLLFTPDMIAQKTSRGVSGARDVPSALGQMLSGTGLTYQQAGGTYLIVRADVRRPVEFAQVDDAGGGSSEVDALIVTAQKREENIQDVPIAMSAFTQESLERSQIAGGPDLITQVPNMSFTKTNFTSYSIQIRGVGTQAISATTDPAVAVAFNNTPFVRNRFFEQEFYDLERLEVLRGPQGTLYGRNATAGVVNLISAKPKFSYDSKASVDIGNYATRRIEGMVNIPLVEDVVALRLAGTVTQRDGYATNQFTGESIDGRDLWSTRLTLRFEPTDWISANLIWEHFQEDDDRLRSGKQLCKKHIVDNLGGIPIPPGSGGGVNSPNTYFSQGCTPVSLYSAEAFQTPNGYALPFYGPTAGIGNPVNGSLDPYLESTQSRDLRVIESSVEPEYRTTSDIAELQFAIELSDNLTLNSETSYSTDYLFSLQDYNRFTTVPNAFVYRNSLRPGLLSPEGVFCDPQLGCSDRLLLVDLSTSESSQFSQEFRVSSDFTGKLNFGAGVNYLRHDAEDKYYVFINSLTLFAANGSVGGRPYEAGVFDSSECQGGPGAVGDTAAALDPSELYGFGVGSCIYIDPNPIGSLNDQGRNYFLSRNPYKLISYAAFGEVYYEITDSLKLTGGLRWTVDRKQAPQIPSWLLASAGGSHPSAAGPYPTTVTVDQEWREPTGRLALDWKPALNFTDETLVYASYAHGYKAGGANPPPPVVVPYGDGVNSAIGAEVVPETFGPEFVDAFELGTKNTLFGGALTLNLTGFYYDYKGYQTSEIRNRSAVNSNFDAEVWGAEVEADWRPTEALHFGFRGGYNGTRLADGSSAIDLMDRTAGDPDWIVVRPFATIPSNCIIPLYVVTAGGRLNIGDGGSARGLCVDAYYLGLDPITGRPYDPTITDYATVTRPGASAPLGAAYASYSGWDPSTAPSGGKGITKDLSGNELPNAPKYTATLTADYTIPLEGDWQVTLHGDYHYQAGSWGRVINSDPYDRIKAFSTVNASAIITNEDAGWKIMAYVKNVFDETAITGAFLNSDDSGLTTNVFLTEPRLYGVRLTKDFTGSVFGWAGDGSRHPAGEPFPLTVEVGGGTSQFSSEAETYAPDWLNIYNPGFPLDQSFQDRDLDWGDTRSVKLTYAPSGDWRVSAAYRFGKTNGAAIASPGYEEVAGGYSNVFSFYTGGIARIYQASPDNHWRAASHDAEEHEIADFMVGREVGIGAFGEGGSSKVSVGWRYAELQSEASVKMDGVPDRYVPLDFEFIAPSTLGLPFIHSTRYTTTLNSHADFEGTGPQVSWDASMRLFGNDEMGHADIEWSAAGGVLFGKQSLSSEEVRLARYRHGGLPEETIRDGLFSSPVTFTTLYDDTVSRSREDDVTVPNLSLTLGVSYAIDRVKVSTGYSYDRFFDAIDGGYTENRQYNRTIQGPYLKLSIGFGG